MLRRHNKPQALLLAYCAYSLSPADLEGKLASPLVATAFELVVADCPKCMKIAQGKRGE
jgi:hypothetical protein